MWPQQGVRWFAGLAGAKGIGAKIMAALKARPSYFKPIIGLERGLTDPITELNMGQTAEVVGHLFGITRAQSDAYAAESHKRLAKAQSEGWLKGEVETAFARDGKFYDHDDGVRPDSTAESLAKLKPVFERPWGKVTAGNSSQITDGASWVILASEEAVAKHGLTPKAVILDSQWSALDPGIMGLGPVLSATELLKRNELTLGGYRDLGIERGVCDAGAGLSRRLERRKVLQGNSRPRRRGRRTRPDQTERRWRRDQPRPSRRAAAATASCCISSTP